MKVGGAAQLHPDYELREMDRILGEMFGHSDVPLQDRGPWNSRLPGNKNANDDIQVGPPIEELWNWKDQRDINPDVRDLDPAWEKQAMMDPGRMAIANLLGGASPQGSKFKLPELGKGMMSMGLGGPQAPVQREIMPLPISDQALLPLLAESAPTGQETASGGNVQPVSTNTPNVQPMQPSMGTTAAAGGQPITSQVPLPMVDTPLTSLSSQIPIEELLKPRTSPASQFA